MRYFQIVLLLIVPLCSGFSLEKIHSYNDNYYDALSLQGVLERPYLNYKSFSTNDWSVDDEVSHPWEETRSPGSAFSIGSNTEIGILDTEWYQSYNHETPYGMNDGGLWQGKGYNSSVSGGFMVSSPYVEVVVYPELYFSQNLDYSLREPSSWSGSEYGYFESGIDTPQRFGKDSFFYYSFGQSQLRFNYNNWTIGVGNQNVWLGPGQHSAIIWSNNADGFPHIDFGLNKSATRFGEVEFRSWWGFLKTSEHYEPASSSYEDFITGFSFSYTPSFLSGLTLGFHKTAQILKDNMEWSSPFKAFDLGIIDTSSMGSDVYDGRASITWSWLFPQVGFEFYGEWAREDYSSDIHYWIRAPEHASGYTLGVKKTLPRGPREKRFFLFNAEISSLVWSMDYFIDLGWGGGFYRHGRTTGYSNNGQVLGAGYGTGGNLQHFEVDYYTPRGMAGVFVTRRKYDDLQLYREMNNVTNSPSGEIGTKRIPVQLAMGAKLYMHLNESLSAGGSMAYVYEESWNLDKKDDIRGFSVSGSLIYKY